MRRFRQRLALRIAPWLKPRPTATPNACACACQSASRRRGSAGYGTVLAS
jgi:hypothetical protein